MVTLNVCCEMLATPTTAGPVWKLEDRPPTESATVLCAGQNRSGTHCTSSLSSHSNLPVIAGADLTSTVTAFAQPPQRRLGGVVATQTVDAGPGWRGLRTEIDPGHAGGVGVHGDPRAEDDLEPVVGAADDVAADEVGVVGLQLGRAL